MLLNLFIAVILEGFEVSSLMESQEFNRSLALKFQNHWSKFDKKGTGFIKRDQLLPLLYSLGSPLGLDKEIEKEDFKPKEFI